MGAPDQTPRTAEFSGSEIKKFFTLKKVAGLCCNSNGLILVQIDRYEKISRE
jgi:hypothetical protein